MNAVIRANAYVTPRHVTAVVDLNPVAVVRRVSVAIAAPHVANTKQSGCLLKNGDRKEFRSGRARPVPMILGSNDYLVPPIGRSKLREEALTRLFIIR